MKIAPIGLRPNRQSLEEARVLLEQSPVTFQPELYKVYGCICDDSLPYRFRLRMAVLLPIMSVGVIIGGMGFLLMSFKIPVTLEETAIVRFLLEV